MVNPPRDSKNSERLSSGKWAPLKLIIVSPSSSWVMTEGEPTPNEPCMKNCNTTFIFKALSPCLELLLFLLDQDSRVLLWYLKAMGGYCVAARTLTE
jgi:hypothetical protein